MSISFTDNSNLFANEFQKKKALALEAIGVTAEGYAVEDTPVDTGRLKNSISYRVVNGEDSVYIGTNVEYAKYVEFLDRRHETGKAHFLRDAATTHTQEYREIAKAALRS